MKIYTIKKAYHWTSDNDLEITGKDFIYTESNSHHGLQCSGNRKQILERCKKICDLIREIEDIQKIEEEK